ncbi:glycosyltransferase involved in cell wall biosynthesis [Albidovulum inexpectatum]|uniref:Glycosyltransferase involved in cell wall biosynthesis n=1 Tax=Albidovulum inexpectatum TaxID=196587 RepID=A0A2S5JDS8_9RHOB|nr:glycosyltransferase family 4 protein [Albidovulum inexpectatum]PPB79652.1 glycosyltransferase involved in cell wall biosynthesis [Albidovulum inexpectatum]
MASTGKGQGRRVLIVVENLPVPFDRRVWAEATTLADAGYTVSVISPKGRGFDADYEFLDGVHVYRHDMPAEGNSALGYLREYGAALWHELRLALRVRRERGVDVLHGCNPPDLIFLVAWAMRPLGVRYLFDHHDICPELYETKFGRRGLLWRAMRLFEWLTFRTALVSIATNESYAEIARRRGGMAAEDVFVVRSGPKIEKLQIRPPKPELKKGARFLIGYVGVIGQQEGLDLLVQSAEHLIRVMGRDDVHFGIVGGGPALDEIRQLVREKGLEPWFTFTGRAPDDLLLDMLNTADICVNPDRVTPMNDLSTMNKIMEYMTLAKPIVQFELKEGRASAGEASLYARPNDPVDFAEKIAQLMDDPDSRERMGRIGRQRIETSLSWAHSVPNLLAAYDRIFQKMGR